MNTNSMNNLNNTPKINPNPNMNTSMKKDQKYLIAGAVVIALVLIVVFWKGEKAESPELNTLATTTTTTDFYLTNI